jgi:hypothetical protein
MRESDLKTMTAHTPCTIQLYDKMREKAQKRRLDKVRRRRERGGGSCVQNSNPRRNIRKYISSK